MATAAAPVVLEREPELVALSGAVNRAAAGAGTTALVSGEAGIGKSSILAASRAALPRDARFLLGRCDDLSTPRVLGPLRDLAGSVGAGLSAALRRYADRDGLYTALVEELTWPGHATVLAIEDVHWADEATLDVLGFLARRVAELPVVLALTFRDDLDRHNPLRRLLEATTNAGSTLRLPLRPLTPTAVAALAGTAVAPADVRALHRLTGGNPFFVHEVVRADGWHADGAEVPPTVVDSVLAQVRRLPEPARDAVERLSVLTAVVDLSLVESLVDGGLPALAGAEEHGLVAVTPAGASFRHELVRRAVVDSLPGTRRAALNGAALVALEKRPDPDQAQLVHHARESGDVAALVRHGPAAARAAAAAGAHREASAHYRALLEHADRFPPAERAELFQAAAIEGYLVGEQAGTAIDSQARAVALRRTLPDPVALGVGLRWLSRLCWWFGEVHAAESAGREAVDVLAEAGDPAELALALSNASQLAMLAWRNDEAGELAERAIVLARELGDDGVLAHSLNNLGTARWAAGDPAGRTLLEESLEVAEGAGLSEHATRSYCNLVFHLILALDLPAAAQAVQRGIAHARHAEHVGFSKYLHVLQGWVALLQGRWEEAELDAADGLDGTSHIRCAALAVQARVAVRRGDDAGAALEEALRLATELDELMRIAPAAFAAVEAAWLQGDQARVRALAGRVHVLAAELGSTGWRAEAAYWLSVVGDHVPVADLDHPYADLARGSWRVAADRWHAAGCPYEEALALASSDEPDDLLAAVTVLDGLGAAPLAQRVRLRLRELGVERVPRGPTRATRANLAGLTARQLDVLGLLARGLSNADIAHELVLSVRTVDHHVSAVIEKLGVSTRHEAVRCARSLGWVPAGQMGSEGAADGQRLPIRGPDGRHRPGTTPSATHQRSPS